MNRDRRGEIPTQGQVQIDTVLQPHAGHRVQRGGRCDVPSLRFEHGDDIRQAPAILFPRDFLRRPRFLGGRSQRRLLFLQKKFVGQGILDLLKSTQDRP